MEKILWSPKIRREKLWDLYQSDAQGNLDEDLLTEVGYGLLARCQSILMIRTGKVTCPRCGTVFQVDRARTTAHHDPGFLSRHGLRLASIRG